MYIWSLLLMIMGNLFEFVPACIMDMCLYIFMSRNLLYPKCMQMMQVRRISHWEDRRIELHMISSVKLIYLILKFCENSFW